MVEAMNKTHDKAERLSIPEGAHRRVGPPPLAKHKRAWSHLLQRGHDPVSSVILAVCANLLEQVWEVN